MVLHFYKIGFSTLLCVLLFLSSTAIFHSKNLVVILLFLVLCFACASILSLILNAEFLAFLIMIIYMGAVIVLFLFSIMLLDNKIIDTYRNLVKYIYKHFYGFIFIVGFIFIIPFLKFLPGLSLTDKLVLHQMRMCNIEGQYKAGLFCMETYHDRLLKIFEKATRYYAEDRNQFLKAARVWKRFIKHLFIPHPWKKMGTSVDLRFKSTYMAQTATHSALHHLESVGSSQIEVSFPANILFLEDCKLDYEAYSYAIYSYFVYTFLLTGIILLLATIMIVVLNNNLKNNKTEKHDKVKTQLSKNILIQINRNI